MTDPFIRLALGAFECDWNPTALSDHSDFFCADDAFSDLEGISEPGDADSDDTWKEGLSRSLVSMRDRLDLLGYTIEHAKEEFEWLGYGGAFDSETFSFEKIYDLLMCIDVDRVSPNYNRNSEHLFFVQEIAVRLGLDLSGADVDCEGFSLAMQAFSSGSVLRILSNNPENLSKIVAWRTEDLFRKQFATFNNKRTLKSKDRFLIVTEGSTDAAVLRHAFKLLVPHVEDFFHYVDMDKGYPFTGTGNLLRFTQGLVSIAIENKVVILFDNDAEGLINFQRASKLSTGPNICVIRLPDLPSEHAIFDTIGPDGCSLGDINGKAAAIECYLPFDGKPRVRWTSYNRELDSYQGEILPKAEIMKNFLSLKTVEGDENLDNIEAVLRYIMTACTKVSSSVRMHSVPDRIG